MQEGYKQTEIGIIPKDWNVVTLADVCSKNGIVRGPFGGALKKEIFVSEGYKVYEQGNAIYRSITRGKYYIDSNKYNEMLRFAVNVGDFIVSCSGTIGMIYKIPKNAPKGIINQALLKLSIDRSVVDSNYFYLYFSWEEFNNRITDDTQGGAIKNLVSMELFKKTWLLLPSLTEQEHIAEALSDVDSMISSLEKLIAKKKAVKQGAMQELLTGKKRLTGFTGEWYETTIGEHCCVFDGTHQTPKYTLTGIPFYSVENVTANDFVNTKFITTEEHEQLSSKCKIEKGDILMTRIGSIGDCKYIDWDVNASFYVSLALIKCKETINAQFLSFYSTSSYFKKEIKIRSLLTAIPQKINLGPISEIRLNIPSDIKEQEAIASILSDMDNEIEALEQKLAKTRQIKQGMMQQLLTGKIRLV